MFREAYELILEILNDVKLQKFILDNTGKNLAIIDTGTILTTPAVVLNFLGKEITNSDNVKQEVNYDIAFMLPFWGNSGFSLCHDFLDVLVEAFFSYEQHIEHNKKNFITRLRPNIIEENVEEGFWNVSITVSVAIFL